MITLVLTQVVTLTALALPITNGAKGISNIPLPSGISFLGFPIIPDFGAMENTKISFLLYCVYSHDINLWDFIQISKFAPWPPL